VNIFEHLKSQEGAAPLMLLILFPLMILLTTSAISMVNTTTVSDIDIQNGVAVACKNAAMRVNSQAQAKGIIRIDPANAHESFRKGLAQNLGLDQNTLAPITEQYVKKPKYWLLVYNGYADYGHKARLYYFNGETTVESNLPANGFPASFAITSNGITSGAGGSYTVELKTPGTIALVEIEANRITGEKTIIAQRWASARIIAKNGTLKVI
jgi:hypothetical protein